MSHCFRLLPAAAVFIAGAAAAQSPAAQPGAAPSPAPAASLSWRAPLVGYQPFSDEALVPWKEANDTVGRIGGWREYARQSQPAGGSAPAPAAAPAAATGPAPAPAAAPAPAPAAPAGHGGHANH